MVRIAKTKDINNYEEKLPFSDKVNGYKQFFKSQKNYIRLLWLFIIVLIIFYPLYILSVIGFINIPIISDFFYKSSKARRIVVVEPLYKEKIYNKALNSYLNNKNKEGISFFVSEEELTGFLVDNELLKNWLINISINTKDIELYIESNEFKRIRFIITLSYLNNKKLVIDSIKISGREAPEFVKKIVNNKINNILDLAEIEQYWTNLNKIDLYYKKIKITLDKDIFLNKFIK